MYERLKNLWHIQQKQTTASTDGTPTRQEDLVGIQRYGIFEQFRNGHKYFMP